MRNSRCIALPQSLASCSIRFEITLLRVLSPLVVLFALTSAASALPVARMRSVKPVVEIQNQPGKKAPVWKLAHEKSALVFNDTVRAGARGSAELLFNNGTRIALRANSQLQILAPPEANKPLVVRVFGALSEIFVCAKGPTEIRTAAGTAAVRGTQYLVRLDAENQTRVTVTEGSVAFYNPQGNVLIHAGQESSAVVGQAPTPPVAVDATGLLQWTFDVTALPLPFELDTPSNGGTVPGAAEIGQAATALQAGDVETALPLLRGVIAQNPASFQAHSLLSLALLQRNDLTGARSAAQTAVESGPRSALAHATLSLVQFFAGQTPPARRQAQQALALDPLSPLALLAYSRAQTVLGQSDEARQALEQAGVLAPDFPLIQRDLGALYLATDRLPQAEAAFQHVLAQNKEDGVALAGLGSVYGRTGRAQEAETTFGLALVAAPRDASVRAQWAAFLIDNGQLNRAREETEAFLRDLNLNGTAPNNPTGPGSAAAARPELGAIFVRLSEEALYRQNLSDAFESGQRAVQLLPASSLAHYQWGRVFLEQERTTQAQAQFRLAVALDPYNARARYALGITQEISASGRDVTRVLGAADAAREGGPSQGLTLRDLQTPGAAERIQAAIQDPTVVRTATRSYGDTQISGALGRRVGPPPGLGDGGDSREGLRNEEISILKETSERRGVFGLTASDGHNDGVRDGADEGEKRASLSYGLKSKGSRSGMFAFGQWEKREYGANTGRVETASETQGNTKKPQILLGFNWQPTDKASTRFLISAEKANLDNESSTGPYNNHLSSLHGEMRHERQLGQNQLLSLGGAWGFRSAQFNSLTLFPDFRTTLDGDTGIRNQLLYARAMQRMGTRLTLTGEIKALRIESNTNAVTTIDPPLPFPPPNGTSTISSQTRIHGAAGLPTLLANYQLTPNTNVRLRARKLIGGIDDFELLSPRDDFLFSTLEAPFLNFGQRGQSYEFEVNHTFPNASFLQLGLFQQSGRGGLSQLERFNSFRFRGARARYEGLLSQRSTFFVSADYNAGKGIVDTSGLATPVAENFSDVPRFRCEVGLQYLGVRGFFAQPTVGYFGQVSEVNEFITPRQQRGGFGLANIRIGKRRGLRQVVYLEARNLFNKDFATPSIYSLDGDQGAGRQIVVGFSRRF